MKTTKDLTTIALFTALLIGVQYIFSFIKGVELVTVLLMTFVYCYGAVKGIISSTIFSIIRCFIFGFYPTVIILYLVYYNLFSIIFGLIGKKLKSKYTAKSQIILIIISCVMTAIFTLLDDLITPLFYHMGQEGMKGYFIYSLSTMPTQIICVFITVTTLSFPLITAFNSIKTKMY